MPEPIEPLNDSCPDVIGIGGDVTCPCGLLKVGHVTGHRALSLVMKCPTCGGTVEVTADAE